MKFIIPSFIGAFAFTALIVNNTENKTLVAITWIIIFIILLILFNKANKKGYENRLRRQAREEIDYQKIYQEELNKKK